MTLELLARLVPRLREQPVLVLLLSRPDGELESNVSFRALVGQGPGTITMSLHELSDEESRDMVFSLLNTDGLPPGLERVITTRAEGNPFFVEELVRSFIHRGLVTRDLTTWKVSDNLDDIELPETVHAIVASSLDRLPGPSRLATQQASVLGRRFSPRGPGRDAR